MQKKVKWVSGVYRSYQISKRKTRNKRFTEFQPGKIVSIKFDKSGLVIFLEAERFK